MLKININDTFYNITKEDQKLKDILVEMGFKQMADDKIYNTVGKMVTLKTAMNFIKISEVEVIDYLKNHNYLVELVDK